MIDDLRQYELILRISVPQDTIRQLSDLMGLSVEIPITEELVVEGRISSLRLAGDPLSVRRRRQHREEDED